jgi:hypothetical protein
MELLSAEFKCNWCARPKSAHADPGLAKIPEGGRFAGAPLLSIN